MNYRMKTPQRRKNLKKKDILESHFPVGALDFLIRTVPGDAENLVGIPPELLSRIGSLGLGSLSRHFQ